MPGVEGNRRRRRRDVRRGRRLRNDPRRERREEHRRRRRAAATKRATPSRRLGRYPRERRVVIFVVFVVASVESRRGIVERRVVPRRARIVAEVGEVPREGTVSRAFRDIVGVRTGDVLVAASLFDALSASLSRVELGAPRVGRPREEFGDEGKGTRTDVVVDGLHPRATRGVDVRDGRP